MPTSDVRNDGARRQRLFDYARLLLELRLKLGDDGVRQAA